VLRPGILGSRWRGDSFLHDERLLILSLDDVPREGGVGSLKPRLLLTLMENDYRRKEQHLVREMDLQPFLTFQVLRYESLMFGLTRGSSFCLEVGK
jgi:hypothetical protein